MSAADGREEPRWRRLHPAGLVVALARSAKACVGVIATVVIIAARGLSHTDSDADALAGMSSGTVILIAAAVGIGCAIALGPPVMRWMTTRYALGARELAWTSGLFFRRRRSLAYDRIHAIGSASPWYLQPFHVVTVTVSAGGGEADITLDAVGENVQLELERLRAAAFREDAEANAGTESNMFENNAGSGRNNGAEHVRHAGQPEMKAPSKPDAVPDCEPVFRATGRDILLYALSDVTLLASALVLWGFWQKISDVLPERVARATAGSVMGVMTRGALAIALAALFVVIVLLMVSVVSAFLRFHGFAIWRRGDDLVISRGLVTRRVTTLPVSRIQSVEIRRNVLRRLLGLRSVRVGLSASGTVGGNGDDDDRDDDQSASTLLPVVGAAQVYGVMARILPEWGLAPVSTRRTGRGLGRYYLMVPTVAFLASGALTAAAFAWFRSAPRMPLPVMLMAVAVPAAMLWWLATRALKWRVDGFAIPGDAPEALPHRIVSTCAERLTLITLVTRRPRVQSFARATTLWREPHGVERVDMPLFVLNGTNALNFHAIRRADADRLEDWLEGTKG
ncbi:PH domain-containing protein [Bifidobacterium avesanii]|uniref:PH domain-containing protein n=1 Tax=Bifidobacterium avesanii TaxID=1798157 RepID=A0A7K3THT1_9BIFI|nr:PH domain-containing protein [Bifidobacterium avesanii]KAB8293609.1 Bacterial PH domain-containing protein [Bifidobacterium avesanii]NEG78254.1 PH domain-containing protein [Bifidobacterium avesanii]